jgi:hypothetical protein
MLRMMPGKHGLWAASFALVALAHCGGDRAAAPQVTGSKDLPDAPESADASGDSTTQLPRADQGSVIDQPGPAPSDAAAETVRSDGAASDAGSGPSDAAGETLPANDAGTPMVLGPPGGVEWQPWPAVDAVPANTCAVASFLGGDATSPATALAHEIWTYNADVRVLTRNRVDVADSAASVRYVRLDAQRRREMVCRSEPQSQVQPFICEEWVRDASGNTLSDAFYGVDEGPLDASVLDPARPRKQAAVAGAESSRYAAKYDELGRIQSTVSYFPGMAWLTFSRDTAGRCSEVLWQVRDDLNRPSPTVIEEIDHWNYAGDQLTSRVITNIKDATDIRGVITYSYDADGTLAATVVDGALDFPQPYPVEKPVRDGLADYIVRTQKQADGGRWIEVLRFGSDGKAKVTRNGTVASAFRWRYFLSPGCAALALPVHASQDCEYERPTSMMPLGWNNPYVTPVPIGTPSPLPD